ncbi:hypothetical protein PAAG_00341 [Paracoccidioides lutzii Pb01]|uniref:Uncharacterized protein n=1 Tax=Paracoccidioides lutzii (strain ATCC MYA-826 / Pb01) TaxID=502779 RepID=C1GP96_PARBA|nr:hypothetical protein PAAG_00341 [Paracoccidioides lutzii Pb01]EEH36018.2 hypothetical protein PAAG_00341 [Paracoccidioides lutzii Pb01]
MSLPAYWAGSANRFPGNVLFIKRTTRLFALRSTEEPKVQYISFLAQHNVFPDLCLRTQMRYLEPVVESSSSTVAQRVGSAEVPRYRAKLLRLAAVLTAPSRAARSAKARTAALIGVTHRAQRRSEAAGALVASSDEEEEEEEEEWEDGGVG